MLSYIFIALFRDTPLGHIRRTWSDGQMAINGHFGHFGHIVIPIVIKKITSMGRRGVFPVGEGMPGAQATPLHGVLSQDLVVRGGEERRGSLGLGATNLFASTFQLFPLLQQFTPPNSPGASISFPSPPPYGGWLSEWKGDWWMLPAGAMTRCAACSVWSPLTP